MFRAAWSALALIVFGGSIASAMFMSVPPTPVELAPIDRALSNVARDQSIAEPQRERLIARLHLLAYVNNSGLFGYRGDVLFEYGYQPCPDYDPARASPDFDTPGVRTTPDQSCARRNFDLDGSAVLPVPLRAPSTPSPSALAHLNQAALHYSRAVELDGRNLRARLGYAWVLDRIGLQESAREQLRWVIRQAISSGFGTEDGGHIRSEALQHLQQLAQSPADRRLLARYDRWLTENLAPMSVTPILVPLANAPFASLVSDAPVSFDLLGNGLPLQISWPTSNAGWLVWDGDGSGDIDTGLSLIGARTWAVFWENGFQAMRALDDNGDGELSGDELEHLAIWTDTNRNGVSEEGEVRSLADHGIVALATRGETTRRDLIVARGGVRLANGETRPLYDWTPRVIAPRPRQRSAPYPAS